MNSLDELHTEMGRFLTESSYVENLMLLFVVVAQDRRPLEEAFVDFMGKTFGQKISDFKKVCDAYPFSETQRGILDEVYSELDLLSPKRNFIVHGSTHKLSLKNKPAQPYRIEMTKGDIQYLTRAFANNLTGPNVFTAADIAAVTEQCVALRNRLAGITNDVLETECGNRQQREGGDVKVRT